MTEFICDSGAFSFRPLGEFLNNRREPVSIRSSIPVHREGHQGAIH
jgi:hypothetical protein